MKTEREKKSQPHIANLIIMFMFPLNLPLLVLWSTDRTCYRGTKREKRIKEKDIKIKDAALMIFHHEQISAYA